MCENIIFASQSKTTHKPHNTCKFYFIGKFEQVAINFIFPRNHVIFSVFHPCIFVFLNVMLVIFNAIFAENY